MPDKIKLLIAGVVAVIVLIAVFGFPFQQPDVAQEPTKTEVDIKGLQELERAVLQLKSTIFALELPQQSLGGLANQVGTQVTNTQTLVGTSSVQVLAASSSRQMATITNCSGHSIYLALEDDAVVDKGILLYTSGSTFDAVRGDLLITSKISAISGGAGGLLCVTYK